MFAGWLAQTAHAYPTWPIAVQQAAGPVLRIRKSRAPPTILEDTGPFGHTREIKRPAPAPRSVTDFDECDRRSATSDVRAVAVIGL